MMTFAGRRERALYPSHWFLLAALFWFPWIYSTANLFLVAWPVRGVAQAVIDWWFANNLLFVWLGLVGLGTAFYFLPKFAGRPLQSHYLALFAFWTLILFGTWCGIPPGAPVPAWMPTLSAVAAALLLVPLLAVAIVGWQTVWGSIKSKWDNTPFCFIGSGIGLFLPFRPDADGDGVPANQPGDGFHLVRPGGNATAPLWLLRHDDVWRNLLPAAARRRL